MTTTATATGDLGQRIARELDELTRIRRDIHAHPEIRFEEHRTSRLVQDELARLGIAFVAGLGGETPGQGTGVLAHLPATVARPGPCVGLRADMDALPIAERTGKAWASTVPGKMHACGHDGHTTILLGAARVLAATEHRPNPVTFVFQPAEEGGGGGELMCRDACLTGGPNGDLGAAIARMYGLHGWPGLPFGVIGTRPGPLLAATDELRVTIRGHQAHAAYPHLGADPIVAGAHIVAAAQTLASRTVSPLDSIVVTFGTFHAGTATNVIPETAVLTGTLRTLRAETRTLASRTVSPLDSIVVTFGTFHAGTATNVIPETAVLTGTLRTLRAETRALAKARLTELVASTARALGCEGVLEIEEGYPVTLNDPAETDRVLATAREADFARGAVVVPEPTMGGEDFAFYANRVPSCFYLLGLRPEDADQMPQLHQPEFDFPDGAIAAGVEMMCRLALR